MAEVEGSEFSKLPANSSPKMEDILGISTWTGFAYESEHVTLNNLMSFIKDNLSGGNVSIDDAETKKACIKFLCDITCDDTNQVVKVFNYLNIEIDGGKIVKFDLTATEPSECDDFDIPCGCATE